MLQVVGTDTLQLITSAAGDIDTLASFMDLALTDPPTVKGSTSGNQAQNPTTAATTTVVAAPGSGFARNVESFLVRNTHATVSNDVTLVLNKGGTLYELDKSSLLPGEQVSWVDGVGFFKKATGFENFEFVRKASDQTFAATTLADVTGMGFAVAANAVYEFEYELIWTTATVTVGVGVALNGPASPTSIQGTASIIGGNPATTIGDIASLGFTAYDTGPLTTSAAVINTNYIARVAALIEVGGTAGTIIPRWKSETATNTVVKAGSYGTAKRVK